MRCRISLSLLLLSLLPACLELEQTITIAADGSGTQDLRLSLGASTLAQVKRATSVMDGGGIDPLQVFDKETVAKELRDAGLVLLAHEASELGDKHRVSVAASFK